MHLERGEHLRREVPAWGSECGRWRDSLGFHLCSLKGACLQSDAVHHCHFVRVCALSPLGP